MPAISAGEPSWRRIRKITCDLLLLFTLTVSVFGQETLGVPEITGLGMPSNRVTVAMALLANATKDPALSHWGFAGASVLVPYRSEERRVGKGLRSWWRMSNYRE